MGKSIKDLNAISSIENGDKILVDRNGKGYAANLSEVLASTEIDDIATIRANAEKGATALQSVPEEYITETELNAKEFSTISYVNTKLQEKQELGGTVLFSIDYNTPNFGTITLSDSTANYKYIDIYCATDDKHCLFQRVYEPNGKYVSFSASLVGGSNYFTKCKVYNISNNTLSTGTYAGSNMAGLWGTHNPESFERSDKYIGCYRVIGYN